ncbi:MAG: ArsC family reductase [Rhodospirillales bacterium]|nr:ArsC family reductase [Rhodospirillales bacterium]MCW8971214.1 ArsC family reductase [Rhodospirillales bacterium]MCW9002314.1 ArsC family reductase [Rhodospirillales bacterium]
MITVYGIRNCDTCRKALSWLKDADIAHSFHDVRRDGLDRVTLAVWADAAGWENLLNRRGTTWRKLSDDERDDIDERRSISLMLDHPALIKRPVFDAAGSIFVGFDDHVRAKLLALKV